MRAVGLGARLGRRRTSGANVVVSVVVQRVEAAEGEGDTMTVVDDYLRHMGSHDWDALANTITDNGLRRDGPFCDAIEGKDAYVAFLRGIIETLQGYVLKVARVSPVSDRLVYVELSETFEVNGVLTEYPECIVFETGDDGKICFVSVFMKTPGADAPVPGGRAS
jgi:hypothetical protein